MEIALVMFFGIFYNEANILTLYVKRYKIKLEYVKLRGIL